MSRTLLTTGAAAADSTTTPSAAAARSTVKPVEDDDDDGEVNFKTPKPGPSSKSRRSEFETPGGLNMEEFRPRPIDISEADDTK